MIQHLNGREVDEIRKTLKSKLSAASGYLECTSKISTIINLKDEEITVFFWALEAFRREMEDGFISRQAAIDALIEWYGCEPTDIEDFKSIIEADKEDTT